VSARFSSSASRIQLFNQLPVTQKQNKDVVEIRTLSDLFQNSNEGRKLYFLTFYFIMLLLFKPVIFTSICGNIINIIRRDNFGILVIFNPM
jgi:hypothetical protein